MRGDIVEHPFDSVEGIRQLRIVFWSFVEFADVDECWLWMLTKPDGRVIPFNIQNRAMSPPRFALQTTMGVLLDKSIDACHTCDVPPCVNPLHLWAGSRSQNMLDAEHKGRLDPAIMHARSQDPEVRLRRAESLRKHWSTKTAEERQAYMAIATAARKEGTRSAGYKRAIKASLDL